MRDPGLRVCVDRVVPEAYQPARKRTELRLHQTLMMMASAPGPDLDPDEAPGRLRMALVGKKMWENGRVLRCRFLGGSAKQRKRTQAKAKIWEEHANVTLKFVARGDAEIRIAFVPGDGSWSAVGTDALLEAYFPRYQPTMNFGWLEDDTEDGEYERVVVHEFGHALGCVHEHQSPDANLKWDETAVYRYFSGSPNFWSREEIEHNILRRYSTEGMKYSRFDAASIMLYMFPAALFTDGRGTNDNTKLSAGDKQFIAQMYPKARGGTRGAAAAAAAESLDLADVW